MNYKKQAHCKKCDTLSSDLEGGLCPDCKGSKLMINNPKGHNRFTPKSELKGKPVSKYEVMSESELKDFTFKVWKKAMEYQNKAAGLKSLWAKLNHRITNYKENKYSDDELLRMVEE